MSSKKPIYDPKLLAGQRKEAAARTLENLLNMADQKTVSALTGDAKASFIPQGAGISHTPVLKPTINFNAAPDEMQVGPGGNTAIVFGRDRPASEASGWGAKGSNTCDTIDIVAGRSSAARGGKGPTPGSVVEPNLTNDAARIYISQLTDVDLNFGIAGGKQGLMKERSAIAMKADGIRVIGKEGVKIVTGRSFAFKAGPSGEKNTLGGTNKKPAPKIELLAGNHDGEQVIKATKWLPKQNIKNLQGVARGENTRDALRGLGEIAEQLIGTVNQMADIQLKTNSLFGANIWHSHYQPAALDAGLKYLLFVQSSLWHTRINKIIWELNYTYPFGYKYVLSRNVYST